MKKRLFVMSGLMIAVLIVLTACGINQNSKIVGVWNLKSMTVNGEEIKPSDSQKDIIQFTFNQDGKGKIKGDKNQADMQWTLEDDVVSISDNNTTIKGKLKDNELYIEQYSENVDLVMMRE